LIHKYKNSNSLHEAPTTLTTTDKPLQQLYRQSPRAQKAPTLKGRYGSQGIRIFARYRHNQKVSTSDHLRIATQVTSWCRRNTHRGDFEDYQGPLQEPFEEGRKFNSPLNGSQ